MEIKIKPIYGPPTRKLAKVMDALELDASQIAMALYDVCRYMQDNDMSYGMGLSQLPDDVAQGLPAKILDTSLMRKGSIYDGIIFYSDNRKFEGYGINKNPILKSEKYAVWKWEQTWLENFAYLHPVRAEAIQSRIDAINKANERIPKRNHDQAGLEKVSTIEIAHRRELAQLMSIWMHNLQGHYGLREMSYRWLQNVWEQQVYIMTEELNYRTEGHVEQRSSKRKTEAAKRDYLTAFDWLTGAKKIYSEEFIKQVKGAAMPFDPTVDYDNLPKQVPEKAPVMKMGYSELMAEFMRWATDAQIDPDSFEAEDAIFLKNKLRKALETALDDHRKSFARAKGQTVPTQEIET